jgi:CRP/FNR family transcriptional regulator, cyclic AMP receptor protein
MSATVEEIAQFLAKVPLFHTLPERKLTKLAKLIRERDYAPDEHIIEQNTIGVGLFILVRGEAKVVRKQIDGNSVELDRLHRFDFFGELSLLEDSARTASVIATEQTKCLALNKLDFMDTLKQDPEMALEMLKVLASRMRRMMTTL